MPPAADVVPLPPTPPWPPPPEPWLPLPTPTPLPEPPLWQTLDESGRKAALVVAVQPLLLALMLVPASWVKFVRLGNRTLAFKAVEEESVMDIAESTTKSPSAGPVTVRPDQVWLLPAGMPKVMSVFLALSVTVTPVPNVKTVDAERLRFPEETTVEELPMERVPDAEIASAPFTVWEYPTAVVTLPPVVENESEEIAVEQFSVPANAIASVAVTEGVAAADNVVSQYWFVAEESTVQEATDSAVLS